MPRKVVHYDNGLPDCGNCILNITPPLPFLLQISFVRQRDFRILSNGHSLFTTDKRFQIIHRAKTIDWILRLKRVQLNDSGKYMCQVRTTNYELRNTEIILGPPINQFRRTNNFPLQVMGRLQEAKIFFRECLSYDPDFCSDIALTGSALAQIVCLMELNGHSSELGYDL